MNKKNEIYDQIYNLLKMSIWGEEFFSVNLDDIRDWDQIETELQKQSIASIPADILGKANIPIKNEMLQKAFLNVNKWHILMYQQNKLVQLFQQYNLSFAVLKGAAADIYYPKPEYRVMGDVDIIVKPQDYVLAKQIMQENAYRIVDDKNPRHIEYAKEGVLFELHRCFIGEEYSERLQKLDKIIYDSIEKTSLEEIDKYSFPMLPTKENGLVLLAHINHHLEGGLGLRQIMDWMLYANRYLDDEYWKNEFQPLANMIGLEKLAVTITRLCQLYLGLTDEITWCRSADISLCKELMTMIENRGNFGKVEDKTIKVAITSSSVSGFFKQLRRYGVSNWELLMKYPFLRSFAWIYQLFRYMNHAFRDGYNIRRLLNGFRKASEYNIIIDKLQAERKKK